MKKITRTSGSSNADLEFGYDASGNRLWKKVIPKGSGAVISTYYYLRDAQGNEMCRYVKYTNTTSQLMYVAQEHSIYGSSRVGVDNSKDTLYMSAAYTPTWGGANTFRRALGLKSFELANHLGNVLVTVSDKPVYKVSSTTIFFQPEITSASDYYPFGAPIAGRSFSSGEYRFGFQNQEKDDEIAGEGNAVIYKYRVHNARLGRFLSIDPLMAKYPHNSPYAFSENRVIDGVELEGLEFLSLNNSGVNINEQQQNDDGTYNITLGSETFDNIGVETFDGQQYFNLRKHLYYGDNGWSASGSESQRMTQWPDRPTFEDMWNNLPENKVDASNLIGGRVGWNFDNNPLSFGNACSIRMCRSLNYSGAKVSPTKD
jgi:RHS repeat-associated protein